MIYCCGITNVVITLILTHVRAYCLKIDFGCGEPPSLKNAELIPNQQMKSSVALYKCKEGFFKTGGEEIMLCYRNNQEKSDWDNSSLLNCTNIKQMKLNNFGMQTVICFQIF